MEFIQILEPNDYRAKEIYQSYISYFPEDERRSEQQFQALFSNSRVKIFSVLKDLKYVGYLICWELTNFVFVEHFEIFSDFRSQKFGSEIVAKLFRDYSHIVLESEPETLTEDALRRINFYKKNGFLVLDKGYSQPSYSQDKLPVDLWLLTNWMPDKSDWIKEEIYDVVYRK